MWGVRTTAGTGVLVAVLCPQMAHAAILINEIAWMGTETSANDEWIELRNTGESTVSLEGWTLTSAGGIEVALSGALSSGAYGVLERTDDTSAPGEMFMRYTGALSNGGDTLTLTNAQGAIEDQVAGGEDWEYIGGDNTTKATAQRTTNGWITATPTAGAQNASEGVAEENDTTSTTTDTNTQEEIMHEPKVPVSDIVITAPTRAYVNQPIALRANPRTDEGRLVRYFWSFGDTATSSAKTPTHTYTHPGNYVVVVEAYYAKEFITARHEIVVLPTTLSIEKTGDGDVRVHNDARYEIDLSNFTVAGGRTLSIPEHTILLPGATLTVAGHRVGYGNHLRVLDPAGAVVAVYDPAEVQSEVIEPPATPIREVSAPTTTSTTSAATNRFGLKETLPNPKEPMVAQVAATGETDPDTVTYLALAGVLVLGIAGVYLRKEIG